MPGTTRALKSAIPAERSPAAGAANGNARRRPRISIHLLVFALLVALIAPAVAFLAHIVEQQNRERELEVSRRGEELVGDIADRLEQEFGTMKTLLAVFASSGWLEEGDYRRLHQRARSALAGTNRHLILLDSELNQILNTRVSFREPIGRTANPRGAEKALEHGVVVVSDLFHGRVADTLVFEVIRPAGLADGSKAALLLTRDAADLDKLLGSALEVSGWSFAVLDGAGRVAMSSLAPGQSGAAVPAACLDTVFGFRTWGTPEREQYVYDRSIDGAPWTVCAWGAAERLIAKAERSWTTLFNATLGWFGLSLVAAIGLSTMISRAISNTARVGEALDAGREVPIPGSFISEVDDVRSSLTRAAAERLRKQEELRLLLHETAHRAKNQIALAVSLVGLSARSAATVEALRDDLTGRLVALGRSIDAMTGRKLEAAPLREVIRVQLDAFLEDGKDRLRLEGEQLLVSQEAAQSLGLVLHELATNASKYGAWSRPEGSVAIAWRRDGDELVLDWSETGAAAAPPERTGFGTRLIDLLVEKSLGGTVHREFGPSGFNCRIVVPRQETGAADAG